MKKQNMQEIFEQLGENHLNALHALVKTMNQHKIHGGNIFAMQFHLLNAAPLMAECLLGILCELEGDELPVKDRPAVYLKIVEVLKEAGIVME